MNADNTNHTNARYSLTKEGIHKAVGAMNPAEKKVVNELFKENHDQNRILLIRMKDMTAEAERHDHASEFFYVLSGEGTMLIGGKLAGEYAKRPGDYRGTKLEGATPLHLKAGDTVSLPKGIAHETTAKGELVYLVAKFNE